MIANIKGYEPISFKSSQLELTILKGMLERDDKEGVQKHHLDKQTFIVDYLCRQPRILKVLGLENELLVMVSSGDSRDSTDKDMPSPQYQLKKNLPLKELMDMYYLSGCLNIRTVPKRNEKAIKALLNKAIAAWTRKLDRQYNKQINLSLPPQLAEKLDYMFRIDKLHNPKMTRNEYLVHLIERDINFRIAQSTITVTSVPISEDSVEAPSNPLDPTNVNETSVPTSEEVVGVPSSTQQSSGYF